TRELNRLLQDPTVDVRTSLQHIAEIMSSVRTHLTPEARAELQQAVWALHQAADQLRPLPDANSSSDLNGRIAVTHSSADGLAARIAAGLRAGGFSSTQWMPQWLQTLGALDDLEDYIRIQLDAELASEADAQRSAELWTVAMAALFAAIAF